MYVVWKMAGTSNSSCYDWFKAGESEDLEEAIEIGNNCGSGYWGIRKKEDGKQRPATSDDGKWVDLEK